MKKAIIFLVLVTLVSAGAFGQMKFGAGFLFDHNANNGIKSDVHDMKIGLKNTSLGGFVFFDISYFEISVSFAHGTLKEYLKGANASAHSILEDLTFLQLELSAFGKFPISLGKVTVFPMAGAGFNMVLTAKDRDGNDLYDNTITASALKDYSQFGLLAGVGFDISLTSAIFLRTEALFHFRLPNKFTKDWAAKEDFNTTFGIGPRIKIGIGYQF